MKDDKDEFHQDNVGQDKEERGQHHRVGGCAAHTCSSSARAHSLEASDKPDDQAVDSGLECRWHEGTKSGALKAVCDELME